MTVPFVNSAATILGASAWIWAPLAAALDLRTAPSRMPRVRLLSFALAWSSLESLGVGTSAALWAAGRADDTEAHYALQRWWANQLVDALGRIAGVSFAVTGLEHLVPGPIVVCARHASIADSLLPAWLLGRVGMRPRYVLKDDLQLDPCLDIVGNRLPNHFVNRSSVTAGPELETLEQLAAGMARRDAAVIFPEGMVVTDGRRVRAIHEIARRNPERARRIEGLRRLGPVRPSGTAALLRGAPEADLVFIDHTGFETLPGIAGATRAVPLAEPIQVEITRVDRAEIPTEPDFGPWLDDRWCALDRRAR